MTNPITKQHAASLIQLGQQLKEAKQIARSNGLRVVERQAGAGKTEYIVYRQTPGGRSTRIGKREDVCTLLNFVHRLASVH